MLHRFRVAGIGKTYPRGVRRARMADWTAADLPDLAGQTMVVTGANPLTGEHGSYPHRPREKGCASYIGIEGTPEAVKEAIRTIKSNGRTDGKVDTTDRGFI